MKKFKLEDLEIESFVTELSNEEKNQILGGRVTATDYTGVTSKCNPKTTESNVSTCSEKCTLSPKDTIN